ncbi:MAG TPA: hypothetical protein VFY50_01220 [Candidatus Nitrosocosmicus sp.]|nr:hypothetical protein [Candidatus Nitrosocosmicus sp.]
MNWLPFSAPAAFDELRPGKPVMDLDIYYKQQFLEAKMPRDPTDP